MEPPEKEFRLMRRKPQYYGTLCCVVGCHNRRGRDSKNSVTGRKYYPLPKDPKLRKAWLKAIPRTKWEAKDWHQICSDHFAGGKKTTVEGSPGYIPSIFPHKEPSKVTPRTTQTAKRAASSLHIDETPTPKRPRLTAPQLPSPATPSTATPSTTFATPSTTFASPSTTFATPSTARSAKRPAPHLHVDETPKTKRPRSTAPQRPPVTPATHGHDYLVFQSSPASATQEPSPTPTQCEDSPTPTQHDASPIQMQDSNAELLEKLRKAESENELLKKKISKLSERTVTLDTIKNDDKECRFYTNMPTYKVFKAFFRYLEKRADGQLKYWKGPSTTPKSEHFSARHTKKPGPQRKLSFEEEFFLSVARLKTGYECSHLAKLFGVSEGLVSEVTTTWYNFMEPELKKLFEMKDSDDNVAACFKDFVGLKVVLDCTEQQVERSSDLQSRKETWSQYKQRDTWKWLIGLSKNLTVNYVSTGHGGRASDKNIINSADTLLDNMKPGEKYMADRAFPPSSELRAVGVKSIIPTFKGRNRNQITAQEAQESEFIARARIHIERIIQRIRTYHILDKVAKLSQKDIFDQMFACCAYLSNFQLPIIRSREQLEALDNIVG